MNDLLEWFNRIFVDQTVSFGGISINLIRVIGFLAVFGASVIIARYLQRFWRKLFTRLTLEEQTQERLLWLIFFCFMFVGLIVGLAILGIEMLLMVTILSKPIQISNIKISFISLFAFFVVVMVAFILSKYLRHVLSSRVLPRLHLATNAQFLLLRLVHISIVALGIILGFSFISLRLTSLAVVFGGFSVGIGFGLQNIASNLISGVIIIFERPIRVGDQVTVGDLYCNVRAINMRSTLVVTPENIAMIVPNSQFISNPVTNWTHTGSAVRLKIGVGVAYGSDTARVKQTLLEVAEEHPEVFKTEQPEISPMIAPPLVRFVDFGDSSLDFELLVWITDVLQRADINSDLHFAIDEKFREYNITIPFPQRDVHFYQE